MLGRKQIRACSVDLDKTAGKELAAALGDLGGASESAASAPTAQDQPLEVLQGFQADGTTSMCEPRLSDALRLPGTAPPLKDPVPTAPAARKVKPVQDADVVVRGAIMMLQMQSGEEE